VVVLPLLMMMKWRVQVMITMPVTETQKPR
jgi:hypothetical protein